MSNTDGEDTQKVSLGELLLNAGTRIVDLEKQSNGQVEIITHLEKELASLREKLATEQDMRSTAEFANRMIIKDLNEKLKQWKEDFDKLHATSVLLLQQIKQKEDENRELVKGIMEIFNGCKTSEAGYANDDGEFAKGKTQAYRYTAKKIKDMLTWLGHNLSA